MAAINQSIQVKVVQPNPISSLLRSRKFLLAMLDAFVGSVSLILTWFLAPDKVMSVMTLFGLWQPVIVAVILGVAVEDAALSKATAEIHTANQSLAEAKIYQDMPLSPSAVIVAKEPCSEPKPVIVLTGIEVSKDEPVAPTTPYPEPQG